jgi:hypothetical protein
MTTDQKNLMTVIVGFAGLVAFLWIMYVLIKFVTDNWIWVSLLGVVILAAFLFVNRRAL